MMPIDPTGAITTQVKALGLYQMGPTTGVLLYRFRNALLDLLYVGVTCTPTTRWQAHKNTAAWWSDVAWLEVEHYPHNAAALRAERAAIRADLPRFNRRSFPGRSRYGPGIARESPATETRIGRESPGPYARVGARATRRVRDRRQETGCVGHPCMVSTDARAARTRTPTPFPAMHGLAPLAGSKP